MNTNTKPWAVMELAAHTGAAITMSRHGSEAAAQVAATRYRRDARLAHGLSYQIHHEP